MRPCITRSLAALLVVTPLMAGCESVSFLSFPPQTRGNKIDPELLAQLVPGTSTRGDVTALIGTPTTRASFDDNTWIYIGEVTKPIIAGTLDVLDQQTVVMTFNQAGVLQGVQTKGKGDFQEVNVVSRVTPTPGNNASVLQQLLGNVGRFNPGGAVGQSTTPLTGGTGSGNLF